MAQLNVSLSADLRDYLDTRASAEGYVDPSDFLRDLVQRDRQNYEADVGRVQALIDEGIASGVVDGEPEDHVRAIMAEIAEPRG